MKSVNKGKCISKGSIEFSKQNKREISEQSKPIYRRPKQAYKSSYKTSKNKNQKTKQTQKSASIQNQQTLKLPRKTSTEINILYKRRNHQPIKNRDQQRTPAWNLESIESSQQSKHMNQLAMEVKKPAILCNQNYALHCHLHV